MAYINITLTILQIVLSIGLVVVGAIGRGWIKKTDKLSAKVDTLEGREIKGIKVRLDSATLGRNKLHTRLDEDYPSRRECDKNQEVMANALSVVNNHMDRTDGRLQEIQSDVAGTKTIVDFIAEQIKGIDFESKG